MFENPNLDWYEHVNEHNNVKADERTDDPNNPKAGEIWYRKDLGVLRRAVGDGQGGVNVIDHRAIFDVPSTEVIEDFNGASISHFDTVTQAGDPTYEIVDRNGDDWFKLTADPSDLGGMRLDVGREITGVGAEMELTDGDVVGNIGILPEQTLSSGAVSLLYNQNNGLVEMYEVTDANPQGELIESVNADDPAEFGEPFTLYLKIEGDTVSARIETYAGEYEISGTLPNPEAAGGQYVFLANSPVQDDSGSIYFDDVRELTDDGQLSPALAHSDLADAPAAAHHTQPTDEEQTFTISGSTEEANTLTLSQAYKSGIANCGFTSSTNISPANDADCYVQDYVTDEDGNITDVVVYVHNTTGSSLDIDVRFFGVPA